MTASVVSTPFGRPATLALARVVQEAKADDRLAPVTVVVPSNLAGLTARRLLGSGELASDGGPTGVANVSFATPYQLAARLGSGALAEQGTVPLTTAVLASAVRGVLNDDPGVFREVRAHAATEDALVHAYGELSDLSAHALEKLRSAPGLAAEVVRVFHATRSRLEAFHDENDVVRAATEAVGAGTASFDELGRVVLHLVDDVTPAIGELVDALAARDLVAVVGLTGDEQADAAAQALIRRLGGTPAPAPRPTTASHLVSVPDATEEARRAVRGVLDAAARGTPFDRAAILYPVADPYARILHEQLDAAGVPWNGPALPRLADAVAGRVLLRVLDLADRLRFDRDDVIELVSTAPVTTDTGRWAPAAAWDRISREAGVIAGLDDWSVKLGHRRTLLEQRLSEEAGEGEAVDEGRRDSMRSEIELVGGLEKFVGDLGQAVGSPPADWAGRCRWGIDLLDALLGPAGRRTAWPDEERDAADRVEEALEELSILDAIEPAVPFDVFRRAVTSQLDRPARRQGRFGHGVLVSSLQLAAGLDLDAVFVIGLAEGVCPAVRRDDTLIPDGARDLTGGELADRSRRLAAEHRQLLAGLAAGGEVRMLVHPRGDHRSGRGSFPSRWLLDQVTSRTGCRALSSDLHTLPDDVIETIHSFNHGLEDAAGAPTATDHDLADLIRWTEEGGDVTAHRLVRSDLGLARGLEAIGSRRAAVFSRWDGNLAGLPLPDPFRGDPLSPTRLETWATCPRRFLLGSLLRVRELERPDDIEEIGAAERGSLVHAVLERFLGEVIARPPGEQLAPGQPWTEADRARVHEIALEMFDEYEGAGVTGRPLLWQAVQRDLLADLDEFLRADSKERQQRASVPEHVEMGFGLDDEDPATIELLDGRVLRLRGRVDRVDRRSDGAPVVYDYKTGGISAYRGVGTDPIDHGRHVQLAVYGEAARQRYGADEAEAYFWFVSRKGEYRRIGYVLDAARQERVLTALATVADGMAAGHFPARSGAHEWFWNSHANCRFCPFDRLCSRDRHEEWDATASVPELAAYRALAEAPYPEEPE